MKKLSKFRVITNKLLCRYFGHKFACRPHYDLCLRCGTTISKDPEICDIFKNECMKFAGEE